jgi:hypothetical protein
MKKFLATILALIYLSTSVGATVHLHYCMGKLLSWGLINNDSKDCTFCGMPKNSKTVHCQSSKNGCCKDEQKHVKVDKDQKATESAYKFVSLSFETVAGNFVSLPDSYVASHIVGYPTTNAPPDHNKVPVFLRNCNFRI